MTTMNCGGGRKLIKNNDNCLQKLVEEYLLENQELTFISIDDMAAALQQKSYRFSRMQKPAFSYLVRKAFDSYCDANNIGHGHGHGKPPGPGVQDSDSDVEIEEPPPRATMNNQIQGLYGRPTPSASAPSPVLPSNSQQRSLPTGLNRGAPHRSGNEENEEYTVRPINYHGIGIGGSGRSGRTWTSPRNDPIPIAPQDVIFSDLLASVGSSNSSGCSESMFKEEDEDGDDDLQIIDEFPHSGTPKSVSVQSTTKSTTPVGAVQHGPQEVSNTKPRRRLPLPVAVPSRYQHTTPPQDVPVTVEQKLPDSSGQAPPTPTPLLSMAKTVEKSRSPGIADASQPKPRGTKRKLDDDEVSTSSRGGMKGLEEKLGKTRKREIVVQESNYTFDDFGGSENLLEEICKLLMHLKHPEMYRTLGVTPPRGFLLHGPPGCGKTLLAQAIAGELKLPILKMAATELISGISGESESNIRDVFEQARSLAPCIIFMDEIDSITPKRENASKEMERRIVAQLLACIDDLVTKPKGDQVLLIGATSRIESIDTSLRRAGRFDREICLGIPNERAREKILRVISKGLKLEVNFDFQFLAKLTPGYVGADLQALVREAAVQAVTEILNAKTVLASETLALPPPSQSEQPMEREIGYSKLMSLRDTLEYCKTATMPPVPETPTPPVPPPEGSSSQQKWITETAPLTEEELTNFCINMKDFEKAHKYVQPSAKREGFATVPDTTWEDIGALTDIRDELQVSILGPVKYSSAFQALGLNAPAGVLLYGPPGCGKTLLAKAVANEAGINFISVKGPELLNMYVGESERAVRQCFQRAKNSAPCVIFFDELDSLCPRRSEGIESGSSSRVVNQLLTEMDGMESRLGVFVMGATNRPDIIDPAILRPGRLDKVLFVNLPSPSERVAILKAITKNGTIPKFAEDVNIEDIGNSEKCENYTGADLASLVREAGIAAFRDLVLGSNLKNETKCLDKDLKIYQRHFELAFARTKPSVSQKDRQKYEKMKEMHSILAVATP